MGIKRHRMPRPGEVLAYMSSRRRYKATPEEGQSGPQVRVAPAPCCANGKRGGSVVISTRTGFWNCFACGKKGNWITFCRAIGDPLPDPYIDPVPVDTSAYDRVRAMVRRRVTGGHHPAVLAYCRDERLITQATLDAWGVTTNGPEALRWPLVAWEGGKWRTANARIRKVLGDTTQARDWFEVKGGPTGLAIGNHLLGLRPAAWAAGTPAWSDEWLAPAATAPNGDNDESGLKAHVVAQTLTCRRVLIIEGQWDAMTAWQLGIPNVLSLPNGAAHVDVGALLRYVPDDAEVWICPDMDAAGEKCAEAFFAQAGPAVRRLELPYKDLNEWLKANPALTADEVLATVDGATKQAAAPKPAEVMIDIWTTQEVTKPADIVCAAPWPILNTRIGGGWRAGSTTGLLAPSGVGKTTLANNVIAQAVSERVKTGVIQLEGNRGDVFAQLRQQIKGWIRPDMDEFMAQYQPYLVMSALAGKEVTVDETLLAADQMMRDGCRLVVIDNWDYITPGDGAGSRIKEKAYAAFQEICKEHQAHGFVVWQPHKIDRAEQINSGKQKGMSSALQDADIYMTLNKTGLMRRLEIEKVRGVAEEEGMSSVVILCYDKETGCLTESKSQADLGLSKGPGKNDDMF